MNKHLVASLVFILASLTLSFGQGSKYAGTYKRSTPIVWVGISNKTISGLEIQSTTGHSIELINCTNITIENCKLGPSKGEGVHIYNCNNITITNCFIDSVATGVYAGASTGIKFNYNDVKNVKGPFPRGQMIQLDEVTGGGNSISYNAGENIYMQSYPEDQISLYKCHGLAADRIRVVGNWIRGGGPSSSGGGIMTGDAGGSYILVKDNILVNPGQYGIALASGNHITIIDNIVFSEKLPFSNVGIYAFNQYPTDCSVDTIMNNVINFTYKDGQLNNTWTDNSCGNVVGWKTNTYDPNLTREVLPDQIIGRAKITQTTTETEIAPKLNSNIRVYPNPAKDHITIESNTEISAGIATIYNLSGQRLLESQLNTTNTEINTSSLNEGVYIIQVADANNIVEKKKIVIRK